jgi:hypothetical protein
MEMVADTSTRVSEHTAENVNWQIRHLAEANILHCALRPEHLDSRLHELDREWDIERAIETNYAMVNLVGLTLGAFWPKWHLLPAVAVGFMLMHSVSGWCPPVPVFRRLGFRTAREIDQERCALMAIRGDFDKVVEARDEQTKARRAMEAVGI